MPAIALVVSGNRVIRAANDVMPNSRYHARVHNLPPQVSRSELSDRDEKYDPTEKAFRGASA